MFEDQWSTVKYIKLFQRHVIPVTNLQKLQKKFGSIFLLCSISIRIWLTIKSAWLLVVLVSAGQMLKSPQQSFDKKNKTAYHWRKEETGNGASIKQFWYNALSEQIWSNWKSTTLEQYVVQQIVGRNFFQLSSTFTFRLPQFHWQPHWVSDIMFLGIQVDIHISPKNPIDPVTAYNRGPNMRCMTFFLSILTLSTLQMFFVFINMYDGSFGDDSSHVSLGQSYGRILR